MQGVRIVIHNATVIRSGRTLLDRVSWEIRSGEHWAVVGGNGAGKTTLLKIVRGELPPGPDGSRLYDFGEVEHSSPLCVRQRIARVAPDMQDAYTRGPANPTGLEVVLSGFFDTPLLYQEATEAQDKSARAILEQLGLAALAEVLVDRMSTGQLRGLLVARALVADPNLLVLDEYLDGLDQQARCMLSQLLETISRRVQILCAAHRSEDVPSFVNRGILLEKGRVSRVGSVMEIGESLVRPVSPPVLADRPSENLPLVVLENVSIDVHGTEVLRTVDWTISTGEHWLLSGRNGAGKSSLLRLIHGELSPSLLAEGIGRVERFGGGGDIRDIRRRMGFVTPRQHAICPPGQSVLEVAVSGFLGTLGLYDEPSPSQWEAARDMLDGLDMGHFVTFPIGSLSHGQTQRVFLARALAHRPELLLLDEPFSGLDAQGREKALILVRSALAAGAHGVFVTHREEDVPPEVNRILFLESGRVAYQGPRESFIPL